MGKGWYPIKASRQAGFSTVELLLAIAIFGFMVTALIGAFVYGQAATAGGGDTVRAAMLAQEGADAARNIRDAAFANLTDGTFGAVQASNTWTLSGASDTSGIYTRRVTVAANGTLKKTITSTVNWTTGARTPSVSVTTQLANWMKAQPWSAPTRLGLNDVTGTIAGLKVATSGNYAYVVRSAGTPNFLVFNITTPATPTLAASLTLTGNAYNVAVSGNYAYVATGNDSGELTVVNITTPTSPTQAALFNATGAADGFGIYVSGNYAYLSRAANATSYEFDVLNITTPTAPALAGFYSSNIAMNEVYVSPTYVYIVTGSTTTQLLRISIANATASTTVSVAAGNVSSLNPGATTTAATTIAGNGDTLYVGQGTKLVAVNGSATTMAILSSVTIGGTINDIAINSGYTYAFLGTTNTAGELQVISIANPASLVSAALVDLSGSTNNINGLAYNSSLNLLVSASANTIGEFQVFGPTT